MIELVYALSIGHGVAKQPLNLLAPECKHQLHTKDENIKDNTKISAKIAEWMKVEWWGIVQCVKSHVRKHSNKKSKMIPNIGRQWRQR